MTPGPWLSLGLTRRFQRVRALLPVRDGVQLPDGGLRIVHLTDLHLRGRRLHPALIDLAGELHRDRPHLVLFTGDFNDDKFDSSGAVPILEKAGRLFAGAATIGTFGIVGNHDGDLVAARLEAIGVTPLDGKRATLELVDLIGVAGTDRLETVNPAAVDDLDRDPGKLTIALSHYPDQIRRLDRLSPDVCLSGHTHGGQICVPWVGKPKPLIWHDSLPMQMAAGIHRFGESWLVVSRGVGTTSLPIRFFCPAEAVEITLIPAKPSC